jgi:hypothetical protein
MQDEMVAELKAAGSGLPPEPSGLEPAATVKESGLADAAVREGSAAASGVVWSQALEGFEDLAATPRAAALKQMTPAAAVSSAAKKKPVSGGQGGAPSSAKRGRVGGKAGGGGKGKRRPGRPAGSGGSKTGGAKKPTRTRLSFSDFDGVTQVTHNLAG